MVCVCDVVCGVVWCVVSCGVVCVVWCVWCGVVSCGVCGVVWCGREVGWSWAEGRQVLYVRQECYCQRRQFGCMQYMRGLGDFLSCLPALSRDRCLRS